jgi:putative membrane protein
MNTAQNGVKNGEYFAAIVIPNNFTQTLLTQTTSNPQQSQIDYIVNEKLSPIAPRITNNTAIQLQSQINLAVDQAKINLESGNSTGIILTKINQNDPNSNPVILNTERIDPVDNYGSSMAPFFLVLSLFIGCTMSIALITTRIKGTKKNYKPISVYFGRMGIFLIISIFQASLMAFMALYSHIQVMSTIMFIITMIYVGLCFMILLYSLTSLFGNIGKALAIILLALQIMGTGGTYPIPLLSTTFQSIAPYLPITYAVEALRQVTAGILWSTYWHDIEMLTIFPAALVAITLLIKGKLDKYAKLSEEKIKESKLF